MFAPMMNACAMPAGLACSAYSRRSPHWLPSPSRLRKRGRSCGVEMIRISRMPAEHQRRQRVVDHRLVVHRQQLLAGHRRERKEPRARAAGEDDSAQVLGGGRRHDADSSSAAETEEMVCTRGVCENSQRRMRSAWEAPYQRTCIRCGWATRVCAASSLRATGLGHSRLRAKRRMSPGVRAHSWPGSAECAGWTS